jgi:hypothetical protein
MFYDYNSNLIETDYHLKNYQKWASIVPIGFQFCHNFLKALPFLFNHCEQAGITQNQSLTKLHFDLRS